MFLNSKKAKFTDRFLLKYLNFFILNNQQFSKLNQYKLKDYLFINLIY